MFTGAPGGAAVTTAVAAELAEPDPPAFDPGWTVAVQLLDGVGVGIFGTLFAVVVADLAGGSGHFNATKGMVGTVHSIGGIVGGPMGSLIVVYISYEAAFLTQAAIAAIGALLFAVAMPETRTSGLIHVGWQRVVKSQV